MVLESLSRRNRPARFKTWHITDVMLADVFDSGGLIAEILGGSKCQAFSS
ncbi:hypothetical protein YC2023_052255 [Brassica napus]